MSEPFAFGGRSVRVIDLSQALSNTTTAFEPMPHEIEYLDHRATIAVAEAKFGLGAEYWREGLVRAHERVTLTTHSGTHIDAPYHYHPTSGGAPARTIEDVPFRWLMGDGVVLELTHCDRRAGITADDVRPARPHPVRAEALRHRARAHRRLAALRRARLRAAPPRPAARRHGVARRPGRQADRHRRLGDRSRVRRDGRGGQGG